MHPTKSELYSHYKKLLNFLMDDGGYWARSVKEDEITIVSKDAAGGALLFEAPDELFDVSRLDALPSKGVTPLANGMDEGQYRTQAAFEVDGGYLIFTITNSETTDESGGSIVSDEYHWVESLESEATTVITERFLMANTLMAVQFLDTDIGQSISADLKEKYGAFKAAFNAAKEASRERYAAALVPVA